MSSTFLTDRRLCGVWWMSLNLPFLFGHPGLPWGEESLLRSIAVNLLLFILPGLAACGWRWKVDRPVPLMLLAMILVSFATFFGLLVLFQTCRWPITTSGMWHATWLTTNVLAVLRTLAAFNTLPTLSKKTRTSGETTAPPPNEDAAGAVVSTTYSDPPVTPASGRAWLVAGCLFTAAYGLYYHAAIRVVPPQPDHDLEVQGTGYALLNRLEPLLLTDRGPHYYFAHPLLLHFYAGGSFLYFDKLDQLRFYDDASQRVRSIRDGRPVAPPPAHMGDYRVVGLVGQEYLLRKPGSPPIRTSVDVVETELIDSHFAVRPGLLQTRTPSIFLSALTVGLLGWWMSGLSGIWWMGALAGAACATSPEVYVRSSYGGYFALSNFLVVCLLMSAAAWDLNRNDNRSGGEGPEGSSTGGKERSAWWACILAGLLAGLANHKLVLLPVSLGMVAFMRFVRFGDSWKSLVHPALAGFAAGTAMFWTHGFLIDAGTFWREHIRTHLVDRVTHVNPLGYVGYPTVRELWGEFSRHTGYILLPMGLLVLLPVLIRRGQDRGRNPSPSQTSTRTTGLPPETLRTWAAWMAVTAVVYSLVDWRMTKHLTPLLVPLHVAPASWSGSGRLARGLVTAVFLGLVVWNLTVLRLIVADFDAFTITPAW